MRPAGIDLFRRMRLDADEVFAAVGFEFEVALIIVDSRHPAGVIVCVKMGEVLAVSFASPLYAAVMA